MNSIRRTFLYLQDGKPKSISNILRDNKLPITVQFPKDHEITVGNQTVSTNNIPVMDLLQTFEEVYLLANFITDGVMSQEVVHVPLYLSRLRLAVITGIKGQPKEKWNRYQQELDRAASYIEFDQEFGNPNIAEYDPKAIHSDTTYSYVEPTAYSNILTLVHRPGRSFDNATYHRLDEGPNVYEEIDNTSRVRQATSHFKHDIQKKPVDQAFKKELETSLINKQEETTPKLTSFRTQETQKAALPPPVGPKPVVSHTTATEQTDSGFAPAIPERRMVPPVPMAHPSPSSAHAHYSNDIPRTTIHPTAHVSKRSESKPQPHTSEKTLREVNSSDDVARLTIEEVSEYLKKLKLDQYVENFKNQLIDGTMLGELDKDILKEDFGMKGIEAIRLIKFAKDGHLPN